MLALTPGRIQVWSRLSGALVGIQMPLTFLVNRLSIQGFIDTHTIKQLTGVCQFLFCPRVCVSFVDANAKQNG